MRGEREVEEGSVVLLSVVALCVEDKGDQGQWEDKESIKMKRTSSNKEEQRRHRSYL